MHKSITLPKSAVAVMRKAPEMLYSRGNVGLLQRPIVAIVGTRTPSSYAYETTYHIARALRKRGVVTVSGAAMGIDKAAHEGAGVDNTIAVLGTGIDLRYPAVNAPLIEAIERQGLLLSPFEEGMPPSRWSFVVRNELIVALGEVLIVAEADEESGSMRSAEYAKQMGKKIYVLPHRLNESRGTQRLLEEGGAEAIYDIDAFASHFGVAVDAAPTEDPFFHFCQRNPTLDEAVARFGERVYEEELGGRIIIRDGLVCWRS